MGLRSLLDWLESWYTIFPLQERVYWVGFREGWLVASCPLTKLDLVKVLGCKSLYSIYYDATLASYLALCTLQMQKRNVSNTLHHSHSYQALLNRIDTMPPTKHIRRI